MKILQIIQCIDPRGGGAPHVVSREIQELVAAGHEVTLLSTDTEYGRSCLPRDEYIRLVYDSPRLAGAEVYLGHGYGRRRPWCNFAYSPDCARWLASRFSDPRKAPDVIQINTTYSHVSVSAAARARQFSIPYLIRPLGNLDQRTFLSGHRFAKALFARVFLRNDLRHASRVVACSDAESEELLRWVPRERLAVVPHGVEVPSSDPREAARLFLERFPRCRDRRVILFLGRVDAIKRPEIIVAAMARLRPRFPDLTLIVAGSDGGHMKALRAAVARHGLEEAVVYAGFVENELKRGAFAVASVLALPSAHENFSIVVAEAMAHGLPVLVTPEVAIHVDVDACGAGLTARGDAESFAEGLAQLLRAGQREEMGRRGRNYVEAHLSWPQIGRRLVTLYEDVAADRRRYEGGD